MNFLRSFRKSDAEASPSEDINIPDAESVVDTHLPSDEYDELQHVLASKDIYNRAAEFARAKTFVEKNNWMTGVSNFGIAIGHTISVITAVGFSFLASYHFTNVNTNPSWQNIATAISMGIVLLIMVVMSELGKAKGEAQMFTASVLRRPFPTSRKLIVVGLILLSLVTSSGGGYLAGLYYSDNSSAIKTEFAGVQSQTVSTFRADSAALESRYAARLAADRETIRDWKKQVESLRNEKVMWNGVMTMPERNRKPANLLLEKITEKEAEISQYTATYDTDLRSLASGKKAEVSSIQANLSESLVLDKEKAFRYGIISILIVVIVEIISLIAHYMKAWFYRGAFLEGRSTNMIEFRERGDRITADAVMAEYARKRARDYASELNRLKGLLPATFEPQSSPASATGKTIWDSLLDEQSTLKAQPSTGDTEITLQIAALKEELDRLKNRPNPEPDPTPQIEAQKPPSKQPASKTFNHFYEQGPPDTTGMEYDVSKNEFRQIKKIQKAYEAWLSTNPGTLPTQRYLIQKTGIRSGNTLNKYLLKMNFKTAGQK